MISRMALVFGRLLAAAVMVFTGSGPAWGGEGEEETTPTWTFRVDPLSSGGAQVIHAEGFATTASLDCTIHALDMDSSRPLVRFPVSGTSTATVELPPVAKDTFVEVELGERDSTGSLFRWRTVLRPQGKSIADYAGPDTLPVPNDFEDYWTRAKEDLAKVAMVTTVTRVADKDSTTGLLHRVEISTIGDTRIVCWYFVPRDALDKDGKATGKRPAMLIMPGYGAEEPPIDRTSSGVITLSVNPRNHGPSREFWKSPVEHLMFGITEPEKAYYRFAYLDCLRAAEFLFSREEVDVERVASEGGSQGGLFAIALAALEPRIKCVCSNVTAFSAYDVGMVLAAKGHHAQYRQLLAECGTTATEARKTLAYVDGAHMARLVKCPVQVNMGDIDPVCPYPCGAVVINSLPEGVEREFHVIENTAHAVPTAMRQLNAEWYRRWLKIP